MLNPFGVNAQDAARIGDRVITVREVDESAPRRLVKVRMEEHAVRQQALYEMLAGLLLQEEARKRGLPSSEALIDSEMQTAGITPLTSQTVSAMVAALGSRLPQSAIPSQEEFMADVDAQARDRVRRALVARLMTERGVEVLLKRPILSVVDEWNPSLGSVDAPVTIVEFSDFQCPYCAKAANDIKKLYSEFPDQVRVVYRHYPLSNHLEAPFAAAVSQCANQQGKFWELHDALFADQKALSREVILTHARNVGVSAGQLAACLAGDASTQWKRDKAVGDDLGVQGTPYLLINGTGVAGAVGYEKLKAVVEDAIRQAASGTSGAKRTVGRAGNAQ
ncbi:thioredoxin domain-containing protein [Luteitalea sp.]